MLLAGWQPKVNTALWNTIQLLFPRHAAAAPPPSTRCAAAVAHCWSRQQQSQHSSFRTTAATSPTPVQACCRSVECRSRENAFEQDIASKKRFQAAQVNMKNANALISGRLNRWLIVSLAQAPAVSSNTLSSCCSRQPAALLHSLAAEVP